MDDVFEDLHSDENTIAEHGMTRIINASGNDEVDYSYRFEAPLHETVTFDDRDRAERYRDLYLVADYFDEDVGESGVPLKVAIQGRAVIATYLYAKRGADRDYIASEMGVKKSALRQYFYRVRQRAKEAETW